MHTRPIKVCLTVSLQGLKRDRSIVVHTCYNNVAHCNIVTAISARLGSEDTCHGSPAGQAGQCSSNFANRLGLGSPSEPGASGKRATPSPKERERPSAGHLGNLQFRAQKLRCHSSLVQAAGRAQASQQPRGSNALRLFALSACTEPP